MKKAISIIVAVIIMAGCLSACSSGGQPAAESGQIQIVTTIFPEYDWVMNILGDNSAKAEVTMLLDTGVDLHSFQPTASDILKISTCDLFIYVGGESDEWVDDALQEASNKDMIVINLLDVLGDAVKEEEMIEGMQEEDHAHEDGEDDHDEEHEHEHEHEHEEGEVEYDEHVWLSLKNAVVLVNSISNAIQKIDPNNADTYKKNTAAYIEKLNALDAEYQAAVSTASVKTLLFGDRFPFRYLVDDYGLSYYAAFVGCSAETEASFETITFLAQKVDELSLHAVMTIEGTDHRIAETIVQNTKTKDQQILTMDSMQSVTAKDVENGTTYLSIIEKNLSVLKDALR
ncbi:MAG: metal ABC transporter substrate-binding protein [Oscillospiraceae bacterium]|nr:metal ABC transporter substrate-binding protein [Oscillospiraceae bacterium]